MRGTYEQQTILQIIPAPPGLRAVYAVERRKLEKASVIVLALIESSRHFTDTHQELSSPTYRRHRFVHPLVDMYDGSLVAEDCSNYIGLELPGEELLKVNGDAKYRAEQIWADDEKMVQAEGKNETSQMARHPSGT